MFEFTGLFGRFCQKVPVKWFVRFGTLRLKATFPKLVVFWFIFILLKQREAATKTLQPYFEQRGNCVAKATCKNQHNKADKLTFNFGIWYLCITEILIAY